MKPVMSTHLFVYNRLEERFLQWIAAAGFADLELWAAEHHFDYTSDAAVTELLTWMGRQRLRIASIHLPFYVHFGSPAYHPIGFADPSPAHRAQMQDRAQRLLEIAGPLGCRRFILHPTSNQERGVNLRRLRAGLDWFAPRCAAAGIDLCLENIISPDSRADRLAALCDDYGGTLGICLDTGHAHIDGGLIFEINNAGRHLRALHLHDNFGSHDEHLPPGRGTIDWHAARSTLALRAPQARQFTFEITGSPLHDEKDTVHSRELLDECRFFWNNMLGGTS